MGTQISLSSGVVYQGVLCACRDTMYPDRWVGIYANPDGTGYVGTEGECSRVYFRTAKSAKFALSRRYGIPTEQIPTLNRRNWDTGIARAYRAQFGQ